MTRQEFRAGSQGALGNLKRMGFDTSLFEGVVTSGEVTHSCLSDRQDDFWKSRRKCIHFTWSDRGAISLDGLGLEVQSHETSLDNVDCIVAHGTEAVGTQIDGQNPRPCDLEEMKRILSKLVEIGKEKGTSIPMIVANPDVVTVHGDELRIMPGTLASWYEGMGGEVLRMGKPDAIIYNTALEMLGLDAKEVFAVGDSLEHDICGAQGMNIASVFVAGGIHKEALTPFDGGVGSRLKLHELLEKYACQPEYTINYFAK